MADCGYAEDCYLLKYLLPFMGAYRKAAKSVQGACSGESAAKIVIPEMEEIEGISQVLDEDEYDFFDDDGSGEGSGDDDGDGDGEGNSIEEGSGNGSEEEEEDDDGKRRKKWRDRRKNKKKRRRKTVGGIRHWPKNYMWLLETHPKDNLT